MRSVVTLLLVGLALVVAAPADAAKRRPCAIRGSETVEVTDRARLYVVRRPGVSAYYACLYRSERRIRLVAEEGHSAAHLRVSGRFLVYLVVQDTSKVGTHELKRLDLRSGGRVTVAGFGHTQEGIDALEDLVLTRRGAVAWIRNVWYGGEPPRRSVGSYRANRHTVLDPGPNVDAGSVAVTASGGRLYWTNGGEPRSARLR